MVNEGNISNKDRAQRQLAGIIKTYNSKVDPANCTLTKTSKGNWRVEDGDKRICVVSKFVLSDDVAVELGYAEAPEPAQTETDTTASN